MEYDIIKMVEDYASGGLGVGPVLWHKGKHKNNSGIFACVRGIFQGCENIANCEHCYDKKGESYCLKDGQYNLGFLAVEEKHQRLVDRNAPGAFPSVKEAIENLKKKR